RHSGRQRVSPGPACAHAHSTVARRSTRSGGPLSCAWAGRRRHTRPPAVPRPAPPPSLAPRPRRPSPRAPAVPLTPEHPKMVGVGQRHPPFLDVRGGQAGDWWPGRVTWVGTTALVTGFEPFGGREENPAM